MSRENNNFEKIGIGRIDDVDKARVGAEAEKPVRDLAREEGITEQEKSVLDNLAVKRGEKAMQKYSGNLSRETRRVEDEKNILESANIHFETETNEQIIENTELVVRGVNAQIEKGKFNSLSFRILPLLRSITNVDVETGDILINSKYLGNKANVPSIVTQIVGLTDQAIEVKNKHAEQIINEERIEQLTRGWIDKQTAARFRVSIGDFKDLDNFTKHIKKVEDIFQEIKLKWPAESDIVSYIISDSGGTRISEESSSVCVVDITEGAEKIRNFIIKDFLYH